VQVDAISEIWWVISNSKAGNERITIQSGSEKYALVFTKLSIAQDFLNGLRDPDLKLETLENWVLKETFLTTLTFIAVTRVMFDYLQGQHNALSAPLDLLQSHCRTQIGTDSRS
jgi:hypothetical protein